MLNSKRNGKGKASGRSDGKDRSPEEEVKVGRAEKFLVCCCADPAVPLDTDGSASVRERRRKFALMLSADGGCVESEVRARDSLDVAYSSLKSRRSDNVLVDDSKSILLSDAALKLRLKIDSGGDLNSSIDNVLNTGKRWSIEDDSIDLCLQAMELCGQQMQCELILNKMMKSDMRREGLLIRTYFLCLRKTPSSDRDPNMPMIKAKLLDDRGPDGDLYRFLKDRKDDPLEDVLLDWVSENDVLVRECLTEAAIRISEGIPESGRNGYLSAVSERIEGCCGPGASVSIIHY